MPARLPSRPNEASWLHARTKPNWRRHSPGSLCLVQPSSQKLPAHPPSPPEILENYRAHKADLEMVRVFVKIFDVFNIPWPVSELGSSQLQLQTCLPWLLTTSVFPASPKGLVLLRSATEQRKGGFTPRQSHGNIVPDYGNIASVTYFIAAVTTITTQTDKTNSLQYFILHCAKKEKKYQQLQT